MAHRSNCINNPNRDKKIKALIEWNKRKHKYKIYEFACIKCEKEYTLKLAESTYKKGKYRKHCSRSCANSHVVTPEQKKKTSEKLKGRMIGANKYRKRKHTLKMVCDLCVKEFLTRNRKQKYCSRICASIANIGIASSMDRSTITKRAYENGKKVYGGNTLWYQYDDIKVQGTYELLTCYILDLWKELGKIQDWNYTNDRFLYIGVDGKEHTYLLDFKIFSSDNFYYVETKGYEKENDKLKWEAVRNKGYHLEIWDWSKIKKNGMGMVVPKCNW